MSIEAKLEEIMSKFDPEWGAYLDIGKGWLPIVIGLHQVIQDKYPDYVIYQIKEKFGTLRYYTDVDSEMQNEIMVAETISSFTCESCGNYGESVKNNGWYQTLCKVCYNKKG